MASQQQSRIQAYLERNKIGPLFEEMMTKLITETPDHPIPFLIGHLQTKQESPGRLHRTLSGSAALWAESDCSENKSNRRDFRSYDRAWQIHPKKPKKSKSDLAVSNISPPSPESKSLPRSIECPSWDWRTKPESRDFDELNHILRESKKLGKALENLSRSIALSDELDQDPRLYNSVLRPRVVGEWLGREEDDADPLAAEMLQPPVPRAKNEGWSSQDTSPAGSLKMEVKTKGQKQQQQHRKKLLAAMLSQDSFDSMASSTLSVTEDEMEDEDDAMELLEDLDDLRMEGVTGLVSSGSKFSQGRSSYCPEPQAKVTLNICSRCARLQGDSLAPAGAEEDPAARVPEQAVPEVMCPLPGATEPPTAAELELQSASQVSAQRYPAWASDAKPVRGTSPQAQRRALQLKELLFSKELENMGKHLAEVEKDLAKLAEQGKLSRSPISPHSSLRLPVNPHSANALPMPGFSSKPNSPSKSSMLPLFTSRTQSPSNPCSRAQTPSRPLTPNSLMMRSIPTASHGNPVRIYRRSRSRPVTPTGQITQPLLTPPGLSSTDSFSLRSTLSEDEFYRQLQAVRQPWLIPSDTESECLERPEQDKCNPGGMRDASKRSVFSGL
ncbi:uncharacterized protein C8orf34 homolog isoform 1-T1 [Clarias gariepinus]|uniref:uncharacterized protein C8orf34 homolog isoform X1 n=1 Tax=Clarias gariepinus TaxID=13013 RepID=UPI00234D2060|nr:uncharacterized protein C8orf34 homolog isoform X1 [Clarias gariepinus]